MNIYIFLVMMALVFALLVALVWSDKLSYDKINKADKALERFINTVHEAMGEGAEVENNIVMQLAKYVHYAVHAAEQMFNKGDIEADDRRPEALDIVYKMAGIDGIEIGKNEHDVVSDLIESECDRMGHKFNFEQLVNGAPDVEYVEDGIELEKLSTYSLVSFAAENGFGLPVGMREMMLEYLETVLKEEKADDAVAGDDTGKVEAEPVEVPVETENSAE